MSARLSGADIEALRQLADTIAESGGRLESAVVRVESALPGPEGWFGPDADGFRDEWGGTHAVRLLDTATMLAEVATKVRDNADAQEATSGEYSGFGGAPGGPGFGPPGSGGAAPTPGSEQGFDWGELAAIGAKVGGVGLAGWKAWQTGSALTTAIRLGDLSRYGAAAGEVYRGAGGLVGNTARQLGMADDLGLLGKLGTGAGQLGRFAGGVGGAFAIYDGANRMFNTEYDGARGVADRVMGGVGIVGGAGGIALALGGAALLGPVGVGVVVGAGLAAGAWALGNMVWDSYGDEISAFAGDAADWVGGTVSDGVDAIGDAAGDVADAAGDAVDAVGDAVGAAGDFVGGLFS